MMRQPNTGCSSADSELAAKKPPTAPMPPTTTRLQPRWRVGMISASSAYATGSMPPAAAPIMKHMPTFHQKFGMAPQIEVPTNMTEDSTIEARRP